MPPGCRIVGKSRCLAVAVGLAVGLPTPGRGAAAAQEAPASAMLTARPAAASRPDTAAGAIAPGDKIILRVWREPTWSDSVLVSEDGTVDLPRIGAMRAAGILPAAFGDSVRARLAVYLRDPGSDLVVLRRVAVLGAVRKPNLYFVDPVTSLREVIALAGGVSEEGDPNRVRVIRDGVEAPVGRWRDVAASAAPIRSGDQVVVGRRPWFARNALTAVSSVAVAVSVLVTALRR